MGERGGVGEGQWKMEESEREGERAASSTSSPATMAPFWPESRYLGSTITPAGSQLAEPSALLVGSGG